MPFHTVLIVDDEPLDRQAMREALGEDTTVLEASDYPEALSVFGRHSSEIEILVADVALPQRNGCELARELLREKPELKVLFVSGHVGAEVCRIYGIQMSDLHFLRKPFRPDELRIRLERVIRSEEPILFIQA